MKITKVELENYRPFKGTGIEFDLSTNGRNIILIKGKNGAGKTSLFHAVHFVFFGESREDEGFSVNAERASEGDGITSVKVLFTHEGADYVLHRQIYFKKTTLTTKNPETGVLEITKGAKIEKEEFSATKNGIPNPWPSSPMEKSQAQKKFVGDIIPEESSKYYFFDGEKIKDYTTKPPKEEIWKVVAKIIGIKAIDNSIEDLKKLHHDVYSKKIRTSKTGVTAETKLQEQATKLDGLRKQAEQNVKDCIKKITLANNSLQQANTRLQNRKKIKEALEGIELRKTGNLSGGNLKSHKEDIVGARKKLSEFHSKDVATIIIQHLMQKINKKHQIGSSIDSQVRKDAITSVENNQCTFCEQELNSTAVAKLSTMSKETTDPLSEFEAMYHHLAKGSGLDDLKTKWSKCLTDISTHAFAITRIEDEIKTLDESIPADADRGTAEDRALAGERTACMKQLGKLEDRQSGFEAKEREHKKAYDEKMDEITRSTSSTELRDAKKLGDKTKEFISAFEEIRALVVARQKKQIEQLASSIHKKLTTKEELYQAIKLDDHYQMQVQLGGPFKGAIMYCEDEWIDPSSGERNVLALAFVEALTQFANIERPVFIDTPFGRLDEEHTYNIAKYFAEKNKQMIILYQPDEIENKNHEAFDELFGKAARHYEITAAQNGFQSFVKEI